MILCYEYLSQSPQVFKAVTGMEIVEFDAVFEQLHLDLELSEKARLDREDRKRAVGGGHPYGLSPRNRVLLTVIGTRHATPCEILGYFFGVSRATAQRTVRRLRPLLNHYLAPPLLRARPGTIQGPDHCMTRED